MSILDINSLRAVVTLLSFLSFVGIVVWAMAKRNQAAFDEAAQLPFADERRATGLDSSTAFANNDGAAR